MAVIELISENGSVVELVGQPNVLELSSGSPGPIGPRGYTATAYPLTVTTNGQTVLPLPVAVTDPTKVGFYVNTTRQRYGVDWTASGTSLTWLATDLTLTTTDKLEILI